MNRKLSIGPIGLECQKCDASLSSVATFLYFLLLQQRSSFSYGLGLYDHIVHYNVTGYFDNTNLAQLDLTMNSFRYDMSGH